MNTAYAADREHALLAELRRATPIATVQPGVHLVLGYDAALAVLRDDDAFSGARPSTLRGRLRAEDLTLQEMDEPRHSEMRELVMRCLPLRDIAGLEPLVAHSCRELVAAFEGRGHAELMNELVRPATQAAVAELLGIRACDRARVYAWAEELKEDEALAPPGRRGEASRAARDAYDDWIRNEALLRRRGAVPDGAFTRLVHARTREGSALSEVELETQIRFLAQAGIGSIVRMSGNLLFELIRAPGRYQRLRARRDGIRGAIEESLRHDPPGGMIGRTCVRNTTVADTPLRAGDEVFVNLVSVNRDEGHFPHGQDFDDARPEARRHLSLGRGRHRCPGGPLARLVGEQIVGALMDAVPNPRLAAGYVYETTSFTERGPKRLYIEFDVVS